MSIFKVNALLLPSSVNPSVWTLGRSHCPRSLSSSAGNVWPGFGDGNNGRVRSKTYISTRWVEMFRHEYDADLAVSARF